MKFTPAALGAVTFLFLTVGCTSTQAPLARAVPEVSGPGRFPASVAESSFEFQALSETSLDCVKVLPNAFDSFDIRKQMIRAAQSEIVFSYYELRMESKPLQLLALLRDAAERGVKVRVLLDAMSSKLSGAAIKHLRDRGVEVRKFNPVSLRGPRMDRRMHDKYAVVDGKLLMVGGRNLTDAYFISNIEAKNSFSDIDAVFVGTSAREALEHFNGRWDTHWVESPKLTPLLDRDADLFSLRLDAARLESDPTAKLTLNMAQLEKQICETVSFQASAPDFSQQERNLEALYEKEISGATTSVEIVNPYIILTSPLKKAIRAALKRGVKVRIVTNSMRSNDVFLAHAAYLNLRPKFIRWGAEVFEFIHSQTIHSKVAVFDRKRVIIGSFNLDPRSAKINSENLVITEDPRAVLPVAMFFDETVALSSKIGKNGKPDGFESRQPGIRFKRRMLNTIFRFSIAPLFRSLL